MSRRAEPRTRISGLVAGLWVIGLACSGVGCDRVAHDPTGLPPTRAGSAADGTRHGHPQAAAGPRGTVTLAFAGDMHFELQLKTLLDHPRGALGPVAKVLARADIAMVNLESAIAEEGRTPAAKELEEPSQRFHFRTSPAALAVLASAGVDVATMANNHGADYGADGLADTLAAIRTSPVAVVGIGRDRRAAFTPYRVSVGGTEFAFLAGDASMREGSSNVWEAGPTTPGIAAAHAYRPRALIAAVRAASSGADVVVVYLHWGAELQARPTRQQQATAHALAEAGADVVVGSHAHVLLGSGWLGDTYVDYGLGNFLWYHDKQPETGVLRLTVRDGQVVADSFVPARIQPYGRPLPLRGRARAAAIVDWLRLRDGTGLAALRHPLPRSGSWSVHRIGPRLRERMRFSHHPGCPVALRELRYLQLTYRGFDGKAHRGELVIHKDYAVPVAAVFRRLYDAGWPIRRMRLVDDYRGDDNRSMAANNTSGYNCRRVAGSRSWSAHAYGAAIDIDPVQNPDLTGASVAPRAARRYARVDRDEDAPPGVITTRSVVVRAFARIGWQWGGGWPASQDYQHFTATG
jgi:poly-gamma-glutamate capsule biosynthesis protein CapA/YwtB (metallophosphatase superfamily)